MWDLWQYLLVARCWKDMIIDYIYDGIMYVKDKQEEAHNGATDWSTCVSFDDK